MKLFLASAMPVYDVFPALKESIYTLETFYWLDGIKKEIADSLMRATNMENFLLDSGAYSFMNAQKGKPADFDSYLSRYIEFINRYDVKYFFELDLDSVIGFERTMQMTKKLEAGTGKKCIPVFHKSRGIAEWHRICKEYDYVAIGTIYEYRNKESVLVKLLRIADSYGTKVHGLGFTSCKKLEKIGFYSVDSTSWKVPMRTGAIAQFNGKEVVSVNGPKGYRLKDYKASGRLSVKAWLDYQKYAQKFLGKER